MIGYLKGKVMLVEASRVMLLVGDVGYLVNYAGSAELDNVLELYVHQSVREDDISLWGFATIQELKLFELLLSVNGVGLKTALQLLSQLGAADLVSAVMSKDAGKLKVPGVGQKTAEKIIIDIYDKLAKIPEMQQLPRETKDNNSPINNNVTAAVSALQNLGYTERDIKAALDSLSLEAEQSVEDIIRKLLANI